MMKFMLCTGNQSVTGGAELLEQWRETSNSWIWVDLYDEDTSQEETFLRQNFALDRASIIEAQRDRHPPSLEIFDDYIFLLLKPLDAESDSLDFNTLQLAMFSGERFLVTRHSKESPYLTKLWKKIEQASHIQESPMSIVTAMSRRVAERYGKVLLDLEQRLDIIEDELFDSPTDTLMKELVGYNTRLRKMHRILTYYVNVFSEFSTHLAAINSPLDDEVDDIYAIIERFNSLSILYQSVITDLIDAYISLNGHKLNQIMKVLTIVTVVFVPLTLLVGIYGMNFEYMPELKNENGYYILLLIMSSIVAVMLVLFKRVRWL